MASFYFPTAQVPLQLKSGVPAMLGQLQKTNWSEPSGFNGSKVKYIKWNTFNKEKLTPTYTLEAAVYANIHNGAHISVDEQVHTNADYKAQCVSFVKAMTVNPGGTSSWKKGDTVTSNTPVMTVIANFKNGNTYPSNGGHVLILYAHLSKGAAYVYDQNYDFKGALTLRRISNSELISYHVVVK